MKKLITSVILLVIILTACFFIFNKNEDDTPTIRIMIGDGISFAPLYVIKDLSLIEKYSPNAKIELTSNLSGTIMNESFIANQVDIAAFSISTFATGLDKGIPYKIASPLAYTRYGLQTNNPNIKSLKDIGSNDKIAVSSLTGSTAIILKIACEKEFGDADALKDNMVTMSASEAELALINRSSGISLHIISLPSILRENQAGCPTIIDDVAILKERCAGTITVATTDFVKKQPDLYNAYLSALEEAVTLINNKDEQAIEIISKSLTISKEEIIESLDSGNLSFSTSECNILQITDFLYKTGEISTKIESLQDISFPNVAAEK